MKLKKIASLMLAGVMAVSMLAGCATTSVDPEPTPDPEEPTATGYSAMLQSKLSPHANSSITLSDDTDLNNALNYAGGYVGHTTITNNFLNDVLNGRGVVNYVDQGLRTKLNALDVAMNYLNDTLSTKVKNDGKATTAIDQIKKLDPWQANHDSDSAVYFTKDNVNTVLLYVVDGSVAMDNVMDEVADDIDTAVMNLTKVADSNELAGENVDDNGTYGDVAFSYTGSVAVYNDVYEAGNGMSISLVAVEIVRHIA